MESLSLSDLTGRQSRTFEAKAASPQQIGKRVHVAVARWEKPWRGPVVEVNGWIIVADQGGKQIVREGSTEADDPDPEILADLKRSLSELRVGKRKVWVVTGRRRKSLRTLLESSGYDVTGSFVDENRASKKASERMRKKKQELNKGRKRTKPRESEKPALWLPNSGRTQGRGGGKLTLSCDASSDTRGIGSKCFVADNGDYRLRTSRTSASVDELELEAITMALKYSVRIGATSTVVNSDSSGAMAAVERVRRAGARGRRFRGVSSGSLSRFEQAWRDAKKQGPVTIHRVLGHSGHPLNEAADQIAYLGFRASTHPREAAEPTLRRGINQALKKARKGLSN